MEKVMTKYKHALLLELKLYHIRLDLNGKTNKHHAPHGASHSVRGYRKDIDSISETASSGHTRFKNSRRILVNTRECQDKNPAVDDSFRVDNKALADNNVALTSEEAKLVADFERRKKKGELPDKIFVTRRSVLTELFEISHIRTIYHIFVAILIVFSLNTILYDVLEKGTFSLNFEMIQYAFGKFPKVMAMWVVMQMSTLLVVYPAFYYYATYRKPGIGGILDIVWICLVIAYQLAFLFIPLIYLIEHELPPASSVIITTEQIRLMMKTHAFIRENTARVMYRKKDDDNDGGDTIPDFSKYLYFLFCPTLVYRDNYPRTQTISWRYVVTNFTQVLACLFYIYYIFERFCVPVFQNFNKDHITPKAFIVSMFGCMMPGTLVLFIGFFAILHSWLNAFAEMLRFGDRLFYKDWWNSTTFSNYYRTWNVVVHDWLYTYIYKDVCKCVGHKYRAGAMACVFLISAVFHEYILTCTFKFFYPVLFVMFTGAGFGFIFLTDKGSNRSWNVFMWVALFIGNGMLMCLYSMEFYARQNCAAHMEMLLDFVIPRSWFCVSPSSKLSDQNS